MIDAERKVICLNAHIYTDICLFIIFSFLLLLGEPYPSKSFQTMKDQRYWGSMTAQVDTKQSQQAINNEFTIKFWTELQ